MYVRAVERSENLGGTLICHGLLFGHFERSQNWYFLNACIPLSLAETIRFERKDLLYSAFTNYVDKMR